MFRMRRSVCRLAPIFIIVLELASRGADLSNLVKIIANTQLTFDGGYAHPSWSPDGTKIIYDKWDYDKAQADIWIMDSNGRKPLQLTTSGAKQPVFSPDGKWIAFVSTRQGKYGIWIMSHDCKVKKRLTTKITDEHPSWSPDGKKIVYTAFSKGNYAIWQMDKDGNNKVQISGTGEHCPSYSPGGEYIAYVKDICIWKMKVGGTGKELLAKGDENREPSWSPDGKRIVFILQKYQPICNVVVINADGTGRQQLTTGPTGAKSPHFSPEGNRIVYIGKGRRFRDNIWVMTIKWSTPSQ